MSRLIIAGLILVLAACSGNTKTESSIDTTLLDISTGTTASDDIEDDTTTVTFSELENISVILGTRMDSIQYNPRMFVLELNGSGDEQQTKTTWYFDSSITLVGRTQQWSSEETDGTSFHIFDHGKLVAFQDEEGTNLSRKVTIFEAELGGIAFLEADGIREDSILKPVTKQQITDAVTEVKDLLRYTLQTLRENQAEQKTKNGRINLRLENKEHTVEPMKTEVVDISVDKKLFDRLVDR